ncbi:hypothetical protein [Campylobacter concisus]|uniref:hypothetical protein n=1 Tax=Campylobacter concisus TaxID=199 RepID=UPI001F3FC1BC|nr:hypothetical protein [Campylobacter concisus]
MLIGSRDSDGSSETRTITLAHNILTTARNAYLWHAMQRCTSITTFTTQKMAFMTKNTPLACALAR